jgi:MFS family permease
VGFAARPFGAIVFGHLGDKIGRKPVLFTTLMLMGGSSIVIGLLPTGQGVGIAIVLVGLRFLQGFSLGGEAIGNQVMTMEHGRRSRRGLLGSLIVVGSPISQVLANLTLLGLSVGLSGEAFASWGWRVPFLASILIVVIAVIIRLKLEETPVFIARKSVKEPKAKAQIGGLSVVRTHPRQVVLLVIAWGGPSFSFFVVAVYGLNYLTKTAGLPTDTSFLILMIANGASVLACIAGGVLSDRIGRKPVVYVGIVGAFMGIALFFTVAGPSIVATALIVALALSSIQFLCGAQPALFAEQFPTDVRFAGAQELNLRRNSGRIDDGQRAYGNQTTAGERGNTLCTAFILSWGGS